MSWAFYFDQEVQDYRIQNGKYAITRGSNSVRERLYFRLYRQLGEWFLNTSVGVNWYKDEATNVPAILGGKLPAVMILSILRAAVLEDPDVVNIDTAQIVKDITTKRGFSVTIKCQVNTTAYDASSSNNFITLEV